MTTTHVCAGSKVLENYETATQQPEHTHKRYLSSSQVVVNRDRTTEKRTVHWDTNVIDNQGKTTYGAKKSNQTIIMLPWKGDPPSAQALDPATAVPVSLKKLRRKPNKTSEISKAKAARSSRHSSNAMPQEPHDSIRNRKTATLPSKHMNRIPPAVPDPPNRSPPTPRPARLPTPDLPEAHHGMFGELPPLQEAEGKVKSKRDCRLETPSLIGHINVRNDYDKMRAQSKRLVAGFFFTSVLTTTVSAARAYIRKQREEN
jgi:hypothetical protein